MPSWCKPSTKGDVITWYLEEKDKYVPPLDQALKLVLEDDRPLKIINAPKNISAAIMRLQSFEDRFLYVIKFLEEDISNYLTESQEAINMISASTLFLTSWT